MAFSIRDLLGLPSMKEASLVAGRQNIDNEISSIMVMEAPDVASWLQPGHLLLSSLYAMQNSTGAVLENLVQQIKELNGAGLVIKTERFVKEIPPELITACDRWAFPLIQISRDVLYNDIQIEAMQELFNEKASLLHYHHSLHMQFTEYALKRPSYEEVMEKLQSLIGNPVALLDHQKNILCTTDKRLQQLQILRQIPSAGSKMAFPYTRYQSCLENPEITFSQIIIEIPNIGDDTHYIVVADLNRKLKRPDYIALENAVCFLQMRLIESFAVSQVKQDYLNDLFDDLLNGKFASEEQIKEAVQTLGLSFSMRYRVVVIRLFIEHKHQKNKTQHKKMLQLFVDRFRFNWKDSFYRIRADRIILVLPSKEYPNITFKERVRNSIQLALKALPMGEVLYHVGIGDACEITRINELGEQPLRIIQFAEETLEGSFVLDASDLGLYHFFVDVSDTGKLLDLVPAPLRMLHKEYPELSKTLKVFLDNKQQLKTSSEQLFLHPKTMRYRIDRVSDLTHIDFDDAEEVLKYSIGFRALRLVSDII